MSSPTSPLLSVEELPRWVKQRARTVSLLSSGRIKILAIASACVIFGYALTSSLSTTIDPSLSFTSYPSDDSILDGPPDYNAHAGPSLAPPQGKLKSTLSSLSSAVTDHLTTLSSTLRLPNITSPGIFTTDLYNTTNTTLSVSETLLSPSRDMLGARARIGKVTIIFGGSAIYERAVRTHEAHDALHGYPLHVLRHGIMDDVWSKPAYILSLLLREMCRPESERLQWLLWVDADTILLNPYVPVETFLPPSPEFDDVNLVVTKDWNGLNNGVFPVRVGQWAVDLFAAIVAFRQYRPEQQLTFRDQSAMDELLKERRFREHSVWAPQRWFNAYQGEHNETLAPFQVRRGDFLVHFAGVGDRVERMGYWLDRVEQHLPDWEIQVQQTSYPAEAREFWAQQRQARRDAKEKLVETKKKVQELVGKTEEQLRDYEARLKKEEVDGIRDEAKKLKEVVEKQDVEVAQIDEAVEQLTKAKAPLETAASDANKVLLKEAHETIFSAEKVLLSGPDKDNAEVKQLEEKTEQLKKLVLSSSWSRADMTRTIDEVRRLRVSLEAHHSAAAAAPSLDPERAAKLAALEKQLLEAEAAKAAVLAQGTASSADVDGEGFQVTHTTMAVEMTTSVMVVMETATKVDDN